MQENVGTTDEDFEQEELSYVRHKRSCFTA
jgi:hypothetical protein